MSDMEASEADPGPAPPDPKFSEDPLEHTSITACLVVLLIIAWLILGHRIQGLFRWTRWVSEGSVACVLGLVSGLALLVWHATHHNNVSSYLSFHSATFFTYMLPPIIFYGGLAIQRELFVSNLLSILSFGVFGTFVSFLLLGAILKGLSMIPNVLSFSDSLALAAIFAATDSVAVLQVLRPEQQPALYSIVLGEGVMNDATSVALLKTVGKLDSSGGVVGTVAAVGGYFCYMFVASCALGLASGLAIATTMKHLQPFSQPQEVSLVGALAFLSYLVAELLGLSGILTLFFCGMVVSHYALQHVSPASQASLLSAFRTLSYLLEGVIFLYVGRDALDPGKWAHASFFETLYIVVIILVIIAVSRACFVFPLAWLHNRWSTHQLSFNESVVIWWAGMMRGAVSVAMVYYQVDPNNNRNDKHAATIVVSTLQIVLFSTIVMGGVTGPLLKMLMPNKVTPPNLTGRSYFHSVGSARGGTPDSRSLGQRLLGRRSSWDDGGGGGGGGGSGGSFDGGSEGGGAPAAGQGWHASDRPAGIELAGPWAGHAADLTRRASAIANARDALGPAHVYTPSGPTAASPPEGSAGSGETARLLAADAAGSQRSPLPDMRTNALFADFGGDAAAAAADSARSEASGLSTAPPTTDTDAAYSRMEMGRSPRHGEDEEAGGAVQLMGEKVLRAAQSWADFTMFETGGVSREAGPADGALGSRMYEKFREFDDKYMQPLFGAEGPEPGSDAQGSAHSDPLERESGGGGHGR